MLVNVNNVKNTWVYRHFWTLISLSTILCNLFIFTSLNSLHLLSFQQVCFPPSLTLPLLPHTCVYTCVCAYVWCVCLCVWCVCLCMCVHICGGEMGGEKMNCWTLIKAVCRPAKTEHSHLWVLLLGLSLVTAAQSIHQKNKGTLKKIVELEG